MFNWIFNHKNKFTYLDHAGATPISERVLSKMNDFRAYDNYYVNPSGIYKQADQLRKLIDNIKSDIAKILHVRSNEIIFTSNSTESCNIALMGYIKHLKLNGGQGIEVITSPIEHKAVLAPLAHLQDMGLIKINYIKYKEDKSIDINHFKSLLNKNVKLISIMYANNETGLIHDVGELGRIIENYNRDNNTSIVYHIDASQAGNYLKLDLASLKCHMLSLNASKIYGPKGVGLLVKKHNIKLDPIIYGGGQEYGLRSGTEDIEKMIGLREALYEASDLRLNECKRLLQIQNEAFNLIQKEINEAIIYTRENFDNKNRDIDYVIENLHSLPNNINIGLPGMLSDEMVIRLSERGYAVSHKSACNASDIDGSYVLMAFGAKDKEAKENIRITMGRDTTLDDIENLIREIKNIYYKYKV